MTVSYSTNLGLALPAQGDWAGSWGTNQNQFITQYLDAAIAGAQVISGSQTAVTLSTTNGLALSQAGSGATGSAQYAVINCTGNPASMLTITAPLTDKTYVIINATSTNQAVKIVGVGPTTGVTVAAARAAMVAWNGTDFVLVATTDASKLAGTLAVANGGTGQTTYTNGELLIGNSTGNTLTKANLTAGTGIAITNGTGSITVGGAAATSSDIGMVKLGDAAVQSVAANAVTATASRTYALQVNASGQGVINVPWTDTVYSLPAATDSVLGGIKLGSATQQTTAANAVTATASRTYALQVNASGQGLVNVPWTDTTYTLPTATDSVLGGIKLGDATVQSVAANAVTATASRTYAVQLTSTGNAVVNVPWSAGTANNPGGSNTQVQYNNAGAFGGSANFVFDGTNVGIGEATPSTYGKFVVGGTASFTSSLVSTSTTLTDSPTFEFRKTANVTSGQFNSLGKISFNGKWGSTAGEQAFIFATSQNVGGLVDANVLKLGVKSVAISGAIGGTIELNNSSLYINSGNGGEISIVNGTLSYDGSNHFFYGNANFDSALTVANVPVVTTTGTQTLSNKTLTSPALGTPVSGDFSTGTFTWPTFNQNTTGSAASATTATNIAGGVANQIPYNTGAGATSFITAPTTATTFLTWNGSAFTWSNVAPSGSTFATDISVNTLTVGKGPNNPLYSTVFGYQAAAAATATASKQTAIGYRALASSTTTPGFGFAFDGSTAVGNSALENSNPTFASANTAVGAGALMLSTTGFYNTAVGAGAAYNMLTGTQATAVGTYAGFSATLGAFVAVGYGALTAATNRTSGSVAVGTEALNKATTNSSNSAIFNENNTAVGHYALYNLSAENTSLSGSSNTALGRSAGSALESGSNNMMLGSGAQGSTTSISNEITLGNSSITTLRCQVTSITSLSDQRDKYDIEDLPLGLSFVNALRPRRYKWDKRDWYVDEVQKEDGTIETVIVPKDGSRAQTNWNEGFVAQEAKAALQAAGAEWFPLVYESNPEKLEMSSGKLIPVLVKAIQELTARIEALEAK